MPNKIYIIIITFLIVIMSVVIHEVMHGYVAKWLGDTTAEDEGRLTLNPLPHIDPIATLALPILLAAMGQPIFGAAKPVPVTKQRLRWDEFGMAIVALAGPLTNLFLAVVGSIILRVSDMNDAYWVTWWAYFIQINVGFFIFNMIPIPPLDGSRVLYAFAPEPLQNLMERIESFGFILIFGLVILGMPIIGPVLSSTYNSIIDFLI